MLIIYSASFRCAVLLANSDYVSWPKTGQQITVCFACRRYRIFYWRCRSTNLLWRCAWIVVALKHQVNIQVWLKIY